MPQEEDFFLKEIEDNIKTFRNKIQIQLDKELKKKATSKQHFTRKIIEFVLCASNVSISNSQDIILLNTRRVLEALIYLRWTREEDQFSYFMYRNIESNINFFKNGLSSPDMNIETQAHIKKQIAGLERIKEAHSYPAAKKPNWEQMAKKVGMGAEYNSLYRLTSSILHCSDFILGDQLNRKGMPGMLLGQIEKYLEKFKEEVDVTQNIPNSRYIEVAKK